MLSLYDPDSVKSSDKGDLDALTVYIDMLLGSGNLTESEKQDLEYVRDTVGDLLDKIASTAEEITAVTEAVNGYDTDSVKSSDKDDIKALPTKAIL